MHRNIRCVQSARYVRKPGNKPRTSLHQSLDVGKDSSCGCQCPLNTVDFVRNLHYWADKSARWIGNEVTLINSSNLSQKYLLFDNDLHPNCRIRLKKPPTLTCYKKIIAFLRRHGNFEKANDPQLYLLIWCCVTCDDVETLSQFQARVRTNTSWCVRSSILRQSIICASSSCVPLLLNSGCRSSYESFSVALEMITSNTNEYSKMERFEKIAALLILDKPGNLIWAKFAVNQIPKLVKNGALLMKETILEAAVRFDHRVVNRDSCSTVLSDALASDNLEMLVHVAFPLLQAGSLVIPDPFSINKLWDTFAFEHYSLENNEIVNRIALAGRRSSEVQFSNLPENKFVNFCNQNAKPFNLQHQCRAVILRNLPVGITKRKLSIESLQLPLEVENYLLFTDLIFFIN